VPMGRLSEGVSDFAAFLQRAGVTPALDLEFGAGKSQNLSDQEVLITSECEWLHIVFGIVLRSARDF